MKHFFENKPLTKRVLLFVSIVYVFIPLLFTFLSKNQEAGISYNFFSFPAYTLILVFFFFIYNREKLKDYVPKNKLLPTIIFSGLAAVSFSVFYYMKYSFEATWNNLSGIVIAYSTAYVAGIIFVAFAIFSLRLFTKTYTSLFVFSLLTFFFYMITQILWQLWDILAFSTGKAAAAMLSLFSNQVVFNTESNILGLKDFFVGVGAPCSGIESLSMFMGLFLLLVVYEQKNLHVPRAASLFFLGLAGTYVLNIIRVSLIMVIGTKYPKFALGMFHSQAGWIFFSIFILIMLHFTYRWMKKNQLEIKP